MTKYLVDESGEFRHGEEGVLIILTIRRADYAVR